jgi:ankyrin repeat protein
MKLLIKHGAQIHGSGALGAAASQGKVEAVKYLLEQGAEPNDGGSGPFPFHALHSSVAKEHREIVNLLLEYGADPRIEDGKEQTALIIGLKKGDEEIIRILETAKSHSR